MGESSNWFHLQNKIVKLKRKRERLVLVEIAFEATAPFRGRSWNGESREEFRERARRRWPIHLTESVDQIFRGNVSPIHFCPFFLSLCVCAISERNFDAAKIENGRKEWIEGRRVGIEEKRGRKWKKKETEQVKKGERESLAFYFWLFWLEKSERGKSKN